MEMLLYNILFLFLSCVLFTVKCHVFNNNLLNISIGIVNTRTVIACGLSICIYSSFDLAQIMICPYVSIQEENIQLIDMKITIEDEDEVNIHLSSQLISPPKLMIKLANHSLVHSSNVTQISTYYLSFSSELTCRFSFLKNPTICFYYPLSMNFIQIEDHFDSITNVSLILPVQTRQRFTILLIIIGIFVIIICLFALYILCTVRFPFNHMIQLDYIIDPQLARQTALALAPEPV